MIIKTDWHTVLVNIAKLFNTRNHQNIIIPNSFCFVSDTSTSHHTITKTPLPGLWGFFSQDNGRFV